MQRAREEVRREFARIPVQLRVRFRIVEDTEAGALSEEIVERPSVWAPAGEAALRDIASGTTSGKDGLLSQAILELASQVVRLQALVLDGAGPMQAGLVVQLSGGGGQLAAELPLRVGARIELRFADEETGAPPVRAIAEIVHEHADAPARYGFRFSAIHPQDQDRLIRFLYRIQRQQLRGIHMRT